MSQLAPRRTQASCAAHDAQQKRLRISECSRLRAADGGSICQLSGLLLISCTIACAAPPVSAGRMSSLRASIDAVTRAGAASCAPRELALAHANFDFAQMELRQGDARRAERHLDEVAENVGAAQVLTPERGCSARASAADSDTTPVTVVVEDHDHDSVPDASDQCPDEIEDKLPPHEADGCKGTDSDADGIVDARDACPNEPEDPDGTQDDDGCPDAPAVASGSSAQPSPCAAGDESCQNRSYPGVTISERELRLRNPISFATDSASLRAASYASLDAVAQVLADNPRMSLEIAAHTDSRGDDARNLELTQQQAESVRKYLVARGVEPTRLTARGYGETRPIEANSTSRGRAINRRIELIRTDVTP